MNFRVDLTVYVSGNLAKEMMSASDILIAMASATERIYVVGDKTSMLNIRKQQTSRLEQVALVLY